MESVPAVIRLIDHPNVMAAIKEERRAELAVIGTRLYEQGEDAETNAAINLALQESQERFADKQSAKAVTRLETAIRWSKALEGSSRLKALRNLRNKHLAHSLEITSLEKQGAVEKTNHGDERLLLWKAIAIVNALNVAVNGAGFFWKGSIRMARENAAALWNGCTFKVLR